MVLNGQRAKYADVIAPYRLVQAKFSDEDTNDKVLDLQKELDLMGLTHSVDHKLQQFLTKVFYAMWKESRDDVPSPQPSSSSAKQSDKKKYRMKYYPYSKLNFCFDSEKPVMFTCCLGDKRFKPDSKSDISHEIKEFEKAHPVTAVFVTNCKSFKLRNNCYINPDSVDWEGKLIAGNSLPRDVRSSLKEHVKVRFLFL